VNLGGGAGAGVEGVAVEDQPTDAVEERTQLIEAAEPAGAVAVVQVGKDTDKAGHDWRGEKRDAETGQCFWAQRSGGGRGGRAKVREGVFWCFSAWSACWRRRRAAGPADDIARIHAEAIGGPRAT
jgi:hypothetical protein